MISPGLDFNIESLQLETVTVRQRLVILLVSGIFECANEIESTLSGINRESVYFHESLFKFLPVISHCLRLTAFFDTVTLFRF